MKKINIAICGASGRMGSALHHLINNSEQYNFVGGYSSKNTLSELELLCKTSDIVIDFSSPDILDDLLRYAVQHKTKLVICTTGLLETQHELMKESSSIIPILYAANTSIGANIIADIANQMAQILDGYDITITDIHHRHKKDAPSGTALMIQDAIGKKVDMHSIRSGGIFGEHKIMFASDDEVIKIEHQALNRNIFAKGALFAAKWILDKEHGLFAMRDVIRSRELTPDK